jgi:hypothetical protein
MMWNCFGKGICGGFVDCEQTVAFKRLQAAAFHHPPVDAEECV